MNNEDIEKVAEVLPAEKLSRFLTRWTAHHHQDITVDFSLQILNKITETLLKGLECNMELLKSHASNAEVALVIMASPKRDWKNAAAIISRFRERAFCNWDWFFKKYGG